MKFGKINCSLYARECVQHIKQSIHVQRVYFPTLILYNSKQKKQNRHDGIEIGTRTAEAIRDEILKIIDYRPKHDEL